METIKDPQLLLDTISTDASEYAYDAEDSNFEVTVKICCEDGWVSSDFIDVNSLKSISKELYCSIDECINNLVQDRLQHKDGSKFIANMESILLQCQQYFSCIINKL